MPRLFLALDLPETIKDRLADISQGIPGADWQEFDEYHLTLRFFGEVPEDRMHLLQDCLRGVDGRAFFLGLQGVGVFPLRGNPEVLWAGVSANPQLQSLRHSVEAALSHSGFGRDERKFHPHVTLAKVKSCRPDWIGEYVVAQSLFSVEPQLIESFSLYSSKLTSEGAIHTALETFYLGGLFGQP